MKQLNDLLMNEQKHTVTKYSITSLPNVKKNCFENCRYENSGSFKKISGKRALPSMMNP